MRTVEDCAEVKFEPGNPTFDAVGLKHGRIDLTDVAARAASDDNLRGTGWVKSGGDDAFS